MTNQKQLVRALSAELLMREARISERQLMLLKWEQIGEGKLILRQREVELSENLYNALLSLPCQSKFIFGRSPLSPLGNEQKTGVIHILWERIAK